jgi:hypothetical protein
MTKTRTRFPLGDIVATAGALDRITPTEISKSMKRHATGDWGELCREDRATNDRHLRTGGQLRSAYQTGTGEQFWIITDSGRTTTTVLLPEEY